MQKIMFNGRYGLTQAVIEGRKTVTRRIEGSIRFQEMADCADEIFYNEDDGTLDMRYEGVVIFSHKCRYKVGEVVAVAQSYESIHDEMMSGDYCDGIYDPYRSCQVHDHIGWKNKMFVCADLMPHRIRITGIRCERLPEISDADCLKEGIRYLPEIDKFYFADVRREEGYYFDNHREAFTSLINKVSGRGTWERNPWVVVYEFELVR